MRRASWIVVLVVACGCRAAEPAPTPSAKPAAETAPVAPPVAAPATDPSRDVPAAVFRTMDDLLAAKAGERDVTLAAACQWASRDLGPLMWRQVASDQGLRMDELEAYWKKRAVASARTASYGTGSFIVRKHPAADDVVATSPQPLTDEEWWQLAGPAERTQWLTARLVETSGWFEVLKVEETPCDDCGGAGHGPDVATADGTSRRLCPRCNGAGSFRSVSYR